MTSSRGPLVVPRRFQGPPSSGNGGWTAGALAERLAGVHGGDHEGQATTVALRLPPPLETPFDVTPTDTGIAALLDGRPVAEARPAAARPAPVAPASAAEAAAAESGYRGFGWHPFPGCFACGPDRDPGDGLRIFPGPLADDAARVAATWTPYDVTVPITWAALDCPGGWSCDLEDRPMVLGTITVRLDRLPAAGEPHVVVGEMRRTEGRKTFTASTLYDADGTVVATAEHVWITINVKDFS